MAPKSTFHIGLLLLVLAGQNTNTLGDGVKTLGTDFNKTEEPRYKLLETLLSGYNPRIRPVLKHTDIVTVRFGIALNQIVELDEKNQILKQQAWVRLYWRDEFMTWDPEEYDGLDTVYVSVEDIWRPDIVLYNSVDQERTSFEVFPAGLAIVEHDGTVKWLMPVILQSLCRIKVENYPFDVQDCPLKFGSWSLDGSKLDITNHTSKIDLAKYVTSVEWEVLDVPCKQNVLHYACCDAPFPDVTCNIRMRRRPAFYLFNLVFPTILLIIIGLFVFCLPPESGEKVSLAITVLLAMTVFMLLVMENVPPNSEAIPMLEQFIGGTIALLTLSTAMAVFVVNFHFRGILKARPPYWVRVFVLRGLAYIVCMRKRTRVLMDGHHDENDSESYKGNSKNSYNIRNGGISLTSISPRIRERTPPLSINGSGIKQVELPGDSNGNNKTANALLEDILDEVRAQNRVTLEELYEKKKEESVSMEWIMVAVVIDRVFFWFLLIVALLMTISLFWKQIFPHEDS